MKPSAYRKNYVSSPETSLLRKSLDKNGMHLWGDQWGSLPNLGNCPRKFSWSDHDWICFGEVSLNEDTRGWRKTPSWLIQFMFICIMNPELPSADFLLQLNTKSWWRRHSLSPLSTDEVICKTDMKCQFEEFAFGAKRKLTVRRPSFRSHHETPLCSSVTAQVNFLCIRFFLLWMRSRTGSGICHSIDYLLI